jgi:hypothetical protein
LPRGQRTHLPWRAVPGRSAARNDIEGNWSDYETMQEKFEIKNPPKTGMFRRVFDFLSG